MTTLKNVEACSASGKQLRACVVGSTPLALECSELIQSHGITVDCVFIEDDDIAFKVWADQNSARTKSLSSLKKIPNSFFSSFDILFSIVNDIIIPGHILTSVKRYSINYHNGPLPMYAGVNATHWAVLNGKENHGITWHIMDEKFDSGGIVQQEFFDIDETDDILSVNLKCREAALKALISVCDMLLQDTVKVIPHVKDASTVHFFESRPSAFCLLPFDLPAKSLYNFFRSCATLGSIPQVNSFGLPKINIPSKQIPLIVKSMKFTHTTSGAVPGTVLEVRDDAIKVTTADEDLLITELVECDGVNSPKAFCIESISAVEGMNIHFRDAHDEKSALYCASKVAAKYEWKWVKAQKKVKHEPPLTWPFISNEVSKNNTCEESLQYSDLPLVTLERTLVLSLNEIVPDCSPEIAALSAFLVYCISLSPTLSGEFDAYCNNLPAQSVKYLLQYVPLSLKLTETHSFQESFTFISQCLRSEINGHFKGGIRQNIVPGDVYLRHPGVLNAPSNVFGVCTGPCQEIDFNFNPYHEVVFQSMCSPNDGQVSLVVHVNQRVLHKYLFHSTSKHFDSFLRAAVVSVHEPLPHFPLCMSDTQLLTQSVLIGAQNEIPITKIHQPVEDQAKRFPHVTAVIEQYTNQQSGVCSFSCHTYSALLQRANDIASALLSYSNSTHALRVALLLERTWEAVAAMIGISRIGASFVLLEDNHPLNELAHILASSGADVVLVQHQSLLKLVKLSSEELLQVKVLPLDLIVKSTSKIDSVVSSSDSLAIIISTSGTTGQRKAVMLKHSSLCNYMSSQIETFDLKPTMFINDVPQVGEYGLANTSFNFDGSIHELFPILWQGGTLVFHPSGSFGSPLERKTYPLITYFFVQPAKLSSVFEDCHMKFTSLRNLSIGGEAWAFDLISPWLAPERKIWNIYGPCEVTVGCTFGEIVNNVHLGRPISNVSLQILNHLKQTVPLGVPGELHVGGAGISLGYSDPQLNAGSFWRDEAGKQWYKTGDLVLLDEVYRLHFVGRILKDRQVKLHGIRVELSGIENLLRRIPSVKFAHVQVETLSTKLQRLVAYVAPEGIDCNAVREALVREVPTSSVPAIIVSIPFSKITLTKSGKLNADQFKHGSSVLVTHPNTVLEETVLKKYCDVLDTNMETFGMDSSFVELGGDSVAAIRLAFYLKELLGTTIEASDIVKYPTPALILRHIKSSPNLKISPPALKLKHKTKNTLSFFQEAIVSMNTQLLGPTYNYGFLMEVSGNVNGLRLTSALEKALVVLNSSYATSSSSSLKSCHKKSKAHFNVKQHDLSHIEHKQAKLAAINEAQIDVLTAINIKFSPTRCKLYYLGQNHYLISVIAHHLVFDKLTWHNFVECLQDLYTDSDSFSTPTDHTAFISHQEMYFLDRMEYLTNFWKNQLHNCSAFVNFPTSFPRDYPTVFHGNIVKMSLPTEVHIDITRLIGQANKSSFFLIMYSILIAKLSKVCSFAVGVTVSLRQALEHDFDKTLGMLISVIPCRFSPCDFADSSITEFMQRVSEWLLNAPIYAHFPFSKLVDIWIRDQAHKHLVPQFLYNYTMSSNQVGEFAHLGHGISTNTVNISTYTSKAELLLDVMYATEGCEFQWEYNSSLFTKAVVTELAKEYISLIKSCLEGMHLASSDLYEPNVPDLSVVPTQIKIESNPTKYTSSLQQQLVYSQYQIVPIDQCCAWHSTFSITLTNGIDTRHILQALNTFPVLMSIPMLDTYGKVYFSSEHVSKLIPLYNEDVSSVEEATAVMHRTWAWPWSFDSNHPLIRCLVVNHLYSGKQELFGVVHQLLFDEQNLVSFVGELWSLLCVATSISPPTSTVTAFSVSSKQSVVQLESLFSCRVSLPSLSVDHSHLPSHILKPDKVLGKIELKEWRTFTDFASLACLFSSLLLSKLQSSSHTHFAYLYPVFESSHHCEEHILPVCLDIDGGTTLNEALEYIEGVLSSIHTSSLNSDGYSYWKMQEEVDPFTSLKSPFHEVVVKMSSHSVLQEEITVQYPRPFLITLSFDYSTMEVTLLSSLSPEQTVQLHSCFSCLLSVLNSSELENASVSNVLSEISLHLSVIQSSETNKLSPLPAQIAEVWNKHADSIAVQCYETEEKIQSPDCIYTYGELEKFVKSLESVITQSLQGGALCLIGILVKGGVSLSMCILASIVSECPFTVLDVTSDMETLKAKVTSIDISLFLVDSSSLKTLTKLIPFLSEEASYIIVDPYLATSLVVSKLVIRPGNNDESGSIDVMDTAFVVYTSGSTGKPKPTPVRKKSLVNFLHWFISQAVCGEPLRWIQFSGHSFDAVVCEVLTQFLCGGSLLTLLNPNLKLDIAFILPLMKRYSIEIVSLVPSVLNILLDSQRFSHCELPQFRKVLCTGEKLSMQLCNAYFQCFPPGDSEVELHNWGGPSECSIAIAHCILNKEPCLEIVPYGALVNNSVVQVVGFTSRDPVPLGYPGDIIISGTPVFGGYATEQAQCPLLEKDERTWYLTGDVGYINTKGQLVFLCRFDSQSKLSGQRVDLDGIKRLIQNLDLPYLIDIILDVTTVLGETSQLICFPKILPEFAESITEYSVQQDLAMHLPSRFVPVVVKCMEQYPRLDSQKVNMQRLRKIAKDTSVLKKQLSTQSSNASSVLASINRDLIKAIKFVHPVRVRMSELHFSVITLDALGFGSIMKVKLYHHLLEKGYDITLSLILTADNLLDLSNKLSAKQVPTIMSQVSPNVLAPHVTIFPDPVQIALIGIHVEVAGALNIDEFWAQILQGKETISHNLPIDPLTSEEQKSTISQYIGSRGTLPHAKLFDANLFGVSSFDAKFIDPQQRLLLQAVWTALEQAGYDTLKFSKEGKVGVFAGAEFPSYLFNLINSTDPQLKQTREELTWHVLRDNVALKIAREFDCMGPCVTIANNCSTLMVALHFANQSLQQHECDLAIVAAATVSGQSSGYLKAERDIYSADGHCRPFSSKASGTVMSDGLTVLLLRRLPDAEESKDNIVCLVKGTYIGNDGCLLKDKQLVPSSKGQLQVLKQVFATSNTKLSSIGLVEAHGTGTKMGDQIELESLSGLFSSESCSNREIPIGSVKGNIGHTGVAAAGPSIVKAALSIQHGVIPPSINCDNPTKSLEKTNLYVNKEVNDWPTGEVKRALVHSVGAMGTNAAAILEEYCIEIPTKKDESNSTGSYPICISANCQSSLQELCKQFKKFLERNNEVQMREVAYTLLYSRRFLPFRISKVLNTVLDLSSWLDSIDTQCLVQVVNKKMKCVAFSGQGVKFDPSIFSVLSSCMPGFKQYVSVCFDSLLEISNQQYRIHNLLEKDCTSEDYPEWINDVPYQHTLHVIAQIGVYHSLCQLGLETDYIIGHSLGEYSAACAAGVFSTRDLIRTVFERGRLILKYAPTGKMVSVHAPAKKVKNICLDISDIEISCLNSPTHCTLSGSVESVRLAERELTKEGIKCRHLPMDYAYHHSCMSCIQPEYEKFLSTLPLRTLRKTLVTTTQTESTRQTVGSTVPHSYWVNHLVTACDFNSACTLLPKESLCIEICLLPTLVHFLMKSNIGLGRKDCVSLAFNMSHAETSSQQEVIINSLSQVWKSGVDLLLHKLPVFMCATQVKLPTYPFNAQYHWISVYDKVTTSVTEQQHLASVGSVKLEKVLTEITKFCQPNYPNVLPQDSLTLFALINRVYNLYGVDVTDCITDETIPHDIAQYVVSYHVRKQSLTKPAQHSENLQTPVSDTDGFGIDASFVSQVQLKLLSPQLDVEKPHIFIINATDKQLHSFTPLACILSLAFNVRGLFASTSHFNLKSVEEYAELYWEKIQQVHTSGDIIIGGFSFGAWVAHSLAKRIEDSGRQIKMLFVIDPPVIELETSDSEQFATHVHSLLTLGIESVRNFTYAPVEGTVRQYGRRYLEESRLLQKYQNVPSTVHCKSHIFLAKERIGYSPSHPKPDYWSRWFAESAASSVVEVPGHHGSCISSLNCHCIANVLLESNSVQANTSVDVPVCSLYEVCGDWEMENIQRNEDLNNLTESFGASLPTVQSCLKLTTKGNIGSYTCMVPNLMKQSCLETSVLFLNSSGTFEMTPEPGVCCFQATVSFSADRPFDTTVTLKARQSTLIMSTDGFVATWKKVV